jgi:ParB family chromosome partitioning protein
LLSLRNHNEQKLIAEEIIKRSLTVRAAEKLIATHFEQNGTPKPTRSATTASGGLSPALTHLQNRLQQHYATHVELHHGAKRGRIEIEYYGNDDLQRLLTAIGLPDEA